MAGTYYVFKKYELLKKKKRKEIQVVFKIKLSGKGVVSQGLGMESEMKAMVHALALWALRGPGRYMAIDLSSVTLLALSGPGVLLTVLALASNICLPSCQHKKQN